MKAMRGYGMPAGHPATNPPHIVVTERHVQLRVRILRHGPPVGLGRPANVQPFAASTQRPFHRLPYSGHGNGEAGTDDVLTMAAGEVESVAAVVVPGVGSRAQPLRDIRETDSRVSFVRSPINSAGESGNWYRRATEPRSGPRYARIRTIRI